MIPLVDYHVHLDLFRDFEVTARKCAEHGVEVFTMTTTPLAWERNCQIAKEVGGIRVGLGLHPQLVAERGGEIELFEKYVRQSAYIGEIGLDCGPKHYRSIEAQKQVFERILKACASTHPKVLSIHSIRAANQVMDMLEQHFPADCGSVVLHWFSGSMSEARRAIGRKFLFSVNAQMLESPNGRNLIEGIPLGQMLTETDGPFTQTSTGSPSKPWDVIRAVEGIAKLKRVSADTVAENIWRNVQRIESMIAPVSR